MGVVQWGALGIGIALVAWPVFQALYGRPQLSFAFDRAGDHSGCVLQVHISNQPVKSAFLLQLGVRRDDANFSLSMLVFDERGNEILKYPEGREPGRLHLPGGNAPLTLRLVSCDTRGARLRSGEAEGNRELAPGTYSLRLMASFAQRTPAAQRMFVVTQRKLDSYWADA
jgi:hypothetical protein